MAAALELDASDNAKHVPLALGQQLVVRLPENATTGYRWTIEERGDLQLDGSQTLLAGQSPGAGATRAFTLSARVAGTSRLELALRKAWETSEAPLQRFSLTVVCS